MGTFVVGSIVVVIAAFIIANMIKKKKKGNSVLCGDDCKHCGGHCWH